MRPAIPTAVQDALCLLMAAVAMISSVLLSLLIPV